MARIAARPPSQSGRGTRFACRPAIADAADAARGRAAAAPPFSGAASAPGASPRAGQRMRRVGPRRAGHRSLRQSTTVCDCSRRYCGRYQNEPIALPVLPLPFQPPNGW